MILTGLYDSPFVRRVAVTLEHYGLAFDREVWSVYADLDRIEHNNPLGRVPALRMRDGGLLLDSSFILDYLDEMVGPDEALIPPAGPTRHVILSLVAVALGLAEKSVAYRGETVRRPEALRDPQMIARLERQIGLSLAWLDNQVSDRWMHGSRMTQADVTTAVAVTDLRHKSPHLVAPGRYDRLDTLTDRCELLECFMAAPFMAG